MMDNRQYVAAVDLGTTKVVIAVAAKAEKNKVEIVAMKELSSKGVIKGDLRNMEQAAATLRDVKNRIEEQLGLTLHEVFIGISGQHIKCNRTSGYVFVHNSDSMVSEVTVADVERLKDEMHNSSVPLGQTIITVLPQTYTLDDEVDISEPVGMEGKRLEAKFNIITGEDAAIERIRRCFSRVGLEVQGVMLQPLASSDAVLSEDEKELGVAVVDIGGGTTDLCIYHDKVIRHIAVLPIGGNVINNDIKSYGILERHVEKLKTTFGEAVAEKAADQKYINIPSISGQAPKEIAVRALAGIIEARMYDIIDFVAEQIEKSGYKGKLGAGIVLTGGGSTLKNLDMLFRNQMELDVRVATPLQHLTTESIEMVSGPKYSTIAGILIDAVRKGHFSEVSERAESFSQPVAASVAAVSSSMSASEYINPAAAAATTTAVGRQSALEDQTYEAATQTQQQYAAAAAAAEQQAQAQAEAEQYDDQGENEYSEEGFTMDDRRRRPGFFGKLKGMFGNMFEEVDDEEF